MERRRGRGEERRAGRKEKEKREGKEEKERRERRRRGGRDRKSSLRNALASQLEMIRESV